MKLKLFLAALACSLVTISSYIWSDLKQQRKFLFVPLSYQSAIKTPESIWENEKSACRSLSASIKGKLFRKMDIKAVSKCSSHSECFENKGFRFAKCGFGFKACCAYTPSKTTYTSPQIIRPNTFVYNIDRISSEYCQVRVDFVEFEIEAPDEDGECFDYGEMTFTRDGESDWAGIRHLCGNNKGQHVYLNFEDSDEITMRIATASNSSKWELKITQYPCGHPDLAPEHCLQYYKNEEEDEGTIKSFNFPLKNDDNIYETTYQLSNTDYKICIGENGKYCTIEYERDPSIDYSFMVSGVSNDSDLVKSTDCDSDFVSILDLKSKTKNCMTDLPNYEIRKSWKKHSPFEVQVYTDGLEIPEDFGNTGFKIHYKLTKCCSDHIYACMLKKFAPKVFYIN